MALPLPGLLTLALLGGEALLAVARGAEEETSASLLAVDDECSASAEGDAACSLHALQRRVVAQEASGLEASSEAESGCHTTKPGESCYGEIMWAKNIGMRDHPDWYPGLTVDSSTAEIQNMVHDKNGAKCPRPCGYALKLWCAGAAAPALWIPTEGSAPTDIKILSYNLFWWSLFKLRHGAGDSAGKLIQANMQPAEFDVMGFQECEDPKRVLEPVGLLGHYEAFLGTHAICMAYNTKTWSLLDRGEGDVAEDMPTRYYGKRGAQWMRLEHRTSGAKLFFVNHHGPLSINSGGSCGGQATAHNLLGLMARHAQVGDAIVLVGDFNANAGSLTVQGLWENLVQAFVGDSFGGVDNIFTNVDRDHVVETKILGSGGSDHNAITATVRVGGAPAPRLQGMATTSASSQAVDEMTGDTKPGYDWQSYWCGLMESNIGYTVDGNIWRASTRAGDPDRCCRACQADQRCVSWVWKDYSEATKGRECVMMGALPTKKTVVDGFVSGLTYEAAATESRKAAANAIDRL